MCNLAFHSSRNKMQPRRDSRRHLRIESLEARNLMAGVVMTDQEQLLLELVNRARRDPSSEAALYGISLNAGLPAGTISTASKQPLSPNQFLTNAAGLHSQDMLNQDFFAHTNLAGKTPAQRATEAGYLGQVGENISWGGSTGAIDQNQHVYARHEGLIRSEGHRQNLMNPIYDELGTGVRYGVFTTGGNNYNASMVTENFGISQSLVFITGVAFKDTVVADNFYTIGEHEAGIVVRARSSTGAFYETVTGPSGGFGMSVSDGTYVVTFSGGSYNGEVVRSGIVVSGENVKADLNATTAVWSSIASMSWSADVTGDGHEDVVRFSGGTWSVNASPTSGSSGQVYANWSNTVTWKNSNVGDFNGDGKQDIVGREGGNWWVGISTGTGFVTSYWGTWAPSVEWKDVSIGDFNGDGRDDIVGQTSGNWWLAISNGNGYTNQYWASWHPTVEWKDVRVGDFNGDGRDDIVGRAGGGWWLGSSTGNSFATTLGTVWADISWSDVNVGDFNGDGKDDLVGRANGAWWVGVSNGALFVNQFWGVWSNAVVWQDVQVADLNGDGRDDIVGRAANAVWAAYGGTSFTNSLWSIWANTVWTEVKTGDFNGDGRDDLAGQGNGALHISLS